MSIPEELRDAADLLRNWWPDCECHEAERAVADWLDAEADEIPPHATHYRDVVIGDAPAVRAARAYLKSDGNQR